ncbi:phage major capsid protein [Clostridium sp. UBA4548]|uniref:phage major capsid protein n=1 Tax=Clostridium sp. UBA4548 TaxID=1946361 RepID=UPI0025C33A22|nr:phage major capsid protein [Clostridium sp. UBA4548]
MTKKQLLEKKNEVIEKMESLLNSAELEQRSLTDNEKSDCTSLENELRELNAMLLETEKKENIGGNNDMEKREFAQQILHGEIRSDSTTHSNAIPTNIANEIIEKLYEVSNVVANAQYVQANGDLEFLVEKEDGFAQVLGETDEITPVDIKTLDKVVLKDKRIGDLVLVSKRLLMNAPSVGIDYVISTLAKRMGKTLEKEIFQADGTSTHLTSGLLKGDVVNLSVVDTITIDDLQNLILSMNPVLLNCAKFYTNRETFNKIALLKDADGKFYVTRDMINDKPSYKVLGVEIETTPSVVGLSVVLANINSAIKMKLAENTSIQVLTERYATSGQIGVLAEFYGDVALVNKQAVKVLK